MADNENRGNFCSGQLPAGGLEPASKGKHGFDIPVTEAKARASIKVTAYVPAQLEPVDYIVATDPSHKDGTRGS